MANRTEYVCRCEMCMKNITYVMRDQNLRINHTMSDDSVQTRLLDMVSAPAVLSNCEYCSATTRQTFVGYRHV